MLFANKKIIITIRTSQFIDATLTVMTYYLHVTFDTTAQK